jgi:hypothetical protein
LATALSNLGTIKTEQGRTDETLQHWQDARTLLEDVLATRPWSWILWCHTPCRRREWPVLSPDERIAQVERLRRQAHGHLPRLPRNADAVRRAWR